MTKLDQNICSRGHSRTPENTYVNPQGYRVCRECRREEKRKERKSYVEERARLGIKEHRVISGSRV